MIVAAMASIVAFFATVAANADEKVSYSKNDVKKAVAMLSGKTQRKAVPVFVSGNRIAESYCDGISRIDRARYDADIKAAEDYFTETKWLVDVYGSMQGKQKKKIDESVVDALRKSLYEDGARYQTLRNYCDTMMRVKEEAAVRAMPKGKVVSIEYSEWGSPRPYKVFYDLKTDSLGQATLNVADNQKVYPDRVKVTAEELDTIRGMIENGKIYSFYSNYPEVGGFPGEPIMLGGPASWSFMAQFDSGEKLSVTVSRRRTFDEVGVIVRYLYNLFESRRVSGKPVLVKTMGS